MKKTLFIVPLLILAAIFYYGCQEKVDITDPGSGSKLYNGGTCVPQSKDLLAGKSQSPVGSVTISNDETTIYILFETTSPWLLTETHVDISVDEHSGKGSPGLYNQNDHLVFSNDVSARYEIPIDETWDCIYILPHSAVYNPVTEVYETAMSGDFHAPRGAAWYNEWYYCICDGPPPPPPPCDEETAFGGNSSGSGPAWWFYFDTQGSANQNIYAGQELMVGGNVNWDGTNLTITLGPGWSLQGVSEPVKVQGYDVLPTKRPAAGLFTLYKGTSLTVAGNGSRYYIIHLDVQYCED